MSIIRKTGLFISAFLLRTFLFIGFTLLGAVFIFTNKDNIKSSLVEVNAYDRFTQSVIDASIEQSKTDPNSIPLTDPNVAQIIRDSLNSSDLQKIAESGIDATYAWLEGDTKTIDFRYDVSANKEILARGSANYAVNRLNSLPECVEIPQETNIFRLTCKPNYGDENELKKQIYDTLIKDSSIFKANVLTEENFPKLVDGQKLSETYPSASTYFTYFKMAPYIIVFLALAIAVMIVLLSKTKLIGLRIVAMSFISTGIILAVIPLLYIYLFPALGISLPALGSGSQSESLSVITNDLFEKMYTSFNAMLLNIAIQVLAVGIILLLLAKFLKPKYIDYANLQKKAGVATSFRRSSQKPKVVTSSKSVPIQTSEKPKRTKKKVSSLEKRFKKL